jgi:alpha-tubulin suppressor-like RCC1 family protein
MRRSWLLVGSLLACSTPPPHVAATPTISIPPVATSSAPPATPPGAKIGPPARKLVAAPGHTCALLVSGEVACWGGGIGPVVGGMRTSVKQPRKIPGILDAIDIATGLYHTCVARSDGKVLCWGWDSNGELGGGAQPTVDDEPVLVPKLDDVVALASRANHTCARRRDGHVLCWGKNDEGQLGRAADWNTMGFAKRVEGVVQVPDLADAAEIVTSHTRSCARRTNGRVVCWGEPLPGVPPGPRNGLQGFPEVSDAVGLAADFVTCAIRANGEALCFGGMAHGSIGPGGPPPPRRALAAKDITSLALGGAAECAATRGGSVVCWGEGVSGELGDGTTQPHDAPTPVLGISDATQVVASWNHMCALRQNRQIVCWGANNEAQLGIGSDDNERMPFTVPGVSAAKIAVGYNQSCAIDSAMRAVCWGHDVTRNQYFERSTPAAVPGLASAAEIALGYGHGCALTPAGGVVCWGSPSNLGAQLPYKNETAVHPISGVADATTISTGESHSCARRRDGTVVCWGQNREGQLGDGTNHPSLAAVVVKGMSDAVDVRCGNSHTCALRKNGDVACWGSNNSGQVGAFEPNGDPSASPNIPIAISQIHNATAIAAGSMHTCAVIAGKVTCWGQEHHGSIMCSHGSHPGCSGQRFVDVPTIGDVIRISAGGRKTCVLRSGAAGSVTCWSRVLEQENDVHETSLDAPAALAVEGEHICALTNGKAACWGRNDAGQVGAPPPYRTSATPIGW